MNYPNPSHRLEAARTNMAPRGPGATHWSESHADADFMLSLPEPPTRRAPGFGPRSPHLHPSPCGHRAPRSQKHKFHGGAGRSGVHETWGGWVRKRWRMHGPCVPQCCRSVPPSSTPVAARPRLCEQRWHHAGTGILVPLGVVFGMQMSARCKSRLDEKCEVAGYPTQGVRTVPFTLRSMGPRLRARRDREV
jgi:hypothetical protein